MDQSCSFIDRNVRDILFDADSTKTDVYGNQDGADWIHHYSQVGYHPIMVNEFHSKVLAASFLRPGSAGSAEEAVPVMEEVLSRVSDTAADGSLRSISFRGDAAFYNGSLMELFEERANPVQYAIRAKGTGRLDGVCIENYRALNTEDDCSWTSAKPFYGETCYLMSNSKRARRVCYKLWFSEEADKKGQICLIPHVFAVITNIKEMTPVQVIEFYCQRGTSENFTKELKDDFSAGTFLTVPLKPMLSNSF